MQLFFGTTSLVVGVVTLLHLPFLLQDSVLGGVGMVDCLPGKSCSLDVEGKSFKDIFVS